MWNIYFQEVQMILTNIPIRLIFSVFTLLLLLSIAACQSQPEDQTSTLQPTIRPFNANSPDETADSGSTVSLEPSEEPTLAASPTLTPLPTVTSPVPTPTSTTEPPPTPSPPPSATFYEVQAGDALLAIAETFNVSPDALATANGYEAIEEFALIAGTEIQIPLCQVHEIVSGNTLAGIAQMCAVTLNELITYNIKSLAPLGSFDAVPVGFSLIIPQESNSPEDLDCVSQPAREQVIEYKPESGEGIYCLSQKFSVSTTTILQANIDRLGGDNVYGDTSLLIPSANGAIYQVTSDDITAGITIVALARWYELADDQILDWNGNRVEDPLSEGQQLYLPGANLIFGVYHSVVETEEGNDE